jgi:hypothetical protein
MVDYVIVTRSGGRRPGFPAGTLFISMTIANRRSYDRVSDMAISMSYGLSSSTSVFNGSSNLAV